MLEIANEINMEKQKVYRCVKKYSIPYILENEVMKFDETAQTRIKSILLQNIDTFKNSSEVYHEVPYDIDKESNRTIEKQLEEIIILLKMDIEKHNELIKKQDRQIEELIKIRRDSL